MKKLFLFALTAIFICSCSNSGTDENPNPNPESSITGIRLNPNALTFESTGGTEAISLYYDYSGTSTDARWKLTGGEPWCTSSKISGGNMDQIVFEVAENNTPDERNATFAFTCGTITTKLVITQKQKDALTVTSSKIEIDATGGVATIEVKANIDYEYEIDKECKDWISPKETRAMQTTTLAFDVAKNTEMKKREGTITIHSGKLSETITIIQAEEKPIITVTQNKYDVSGDGETIEVEINSNIDLEIIPEADWIRETQPRTISPHKKYFVISANSGTQSRTGEINITSRMYDIIPARVTVYQAAASYVTIHVPQKGTLESVLTNKGLDNNSLITLKITGELNDVDFLSINHIMPNLRNLDIAEVNITTLPAKAFYNSQNVENLILPNTLTKIGSVMFYGSNLRSITIPNGVTAIEVSAFKDCDLTSINIPTSVKTIGTDAFSFCRSLSSVKISAGVETIEESAFRFCPNLTKVTFEKNSQLKTIGGASDNSLRGAFSACTALTSIEIPASVETIAESAFKGCSELTTVTFENGSQLKIIGGVNNYGAFSDCTALTSIEIPASVETIAESAFKGCSELTTVTFENGSHLKTIEGECYFSTLSSYYFGAFSDLPNLTTVDMSGCTQIESLGASAFYGCSALQLFKIGTPTPPACDGGYTFSFLNSNSVLQVPAGCATAYKTAPGWRDFTTATVIK